MWEYKEVEIEGLDNYFLKISTFIDEGWFVVSALISVSTKKRTVYFKRWVPIKK